MKGKTIGCAAVVIALLSGSLVEAAEENNDEWMKKHAVVKNTESTTRDSNGNVASIKTVNDTTIYIKQTVTEIQKADGKGGMYTASRTTATLDTLGASATIVESATVASPSLATTSITTVDKTAEGTVTTVYARDKTGNMAMISQTTAVIKNNGVAPTVTLQ
ncbi:MAG: hypothetical protein A2283_04945 [Lentisphaerae bacterium RIFOXYA12_FULL_48_11]|nr:MAG: hypothetical protein A2283_04945 [Lentisphaerae bacterium RIFOXYA12_FULL_48_11]